MPGPIRRLRRFRERWRSTHDAVRHLQDGARTSLEEAREARQVSERAAVAAEGAQAAVDRLGAANHVITTALHRLEAVQARSELHARIVPTTHWLETADVPEHALTSVVLATRNRPDHLRGAIASVLEQRYRNWELLVVDDGDEDAADAIEVDDPRVHWIRGPAAGVSAARNLGLERARGDLIAYLDDDNRMHPLWLKAVAWGSTVRPDADVFYGARVVETPEGLPDRPRTSFPVLQFEPFHRRKLEDGNFVDLGTVAHRAGVEGAHFDEDLTSHVDWDLILRLTARRPAIPLPAIACIYTTSASDRIQDRADHSVGRDLVRAKSRAARPLRILAYNPMFPLISETYIEEELEALCRVNADVVYARREVPPTEMPIDRPLYSSLEAALADYDPDLVFLHWLTWAHEQLPVLESTGLPFAVRVHSFDFDEDTGREVAAHPSCVGLWGYAHHVPSLPKARVLPPIFTSADRLPEPSANRDLVLSVSAGLPKKDWPLLVDALARVDGADREIIVATTLHMEEVPEQVAAMAARHPNGPSVLVDLPRHRIFAKLARAAAVVYTLEPGRTFGNPMSVVEGLCAGASVILPDREEARRFAGPTARYYRSGDDIVGHLKDVLGGGPAIIEEQTANRRFGLAAFADPALGRRFYSEVVESLDEWRRATRPS